MIVERSETANIGRFALFLFAEKAIVVLFWSGSHDIDGERAVDGRRTMHDGELLTVEEAAERLKVSKHTLNRWRVEGCGPPFLKLARVVRYLDTAIDDWLVQRIRNSTHEPDSNGAPEAPPEEIAES